MRRIRAEEKVKEIKQTLVKKTILNSILKVLRLGIPI